MSTTNGTSGTAKRDDDSLPLTELETAEILQSIRNSTTIPSTDLPADLALSYDLDRQRLQPPTDQEPPDLASYYWDASTMAPLNTVSAVSIATI